ncbi:MAG: hypothetical protein A2600_10670 [Candidatus Lambdaproteobacteria bacterium RIFOXYD1_FULL_56_27]|uniref:Lipoprotein n=1 Tax=Candidatus Lambdaproteobacteria bacterium RIFOXYD2_FULL_56_26 TaxID=1817773 RepID=A0A1F6GZH7_9PROT|nr:MAG: hypothetical protein A2426_01115 [Candidatus Lambdaproteobacteria bacterium RIFOXYC1_FULL_56_13]OGH03454.1 MAG: hypothetical protein A2557_01730 [Candidatus Lambdaproteobacteria bacterium RIFOXYD2_FULL_56_26]OGH08239.1 MAG: hypothetical protein A2600_10670 [Candidatus Lambdaproteobacteria bacterium RIFOXYD1_FULL_56_27]
MKRQGQRITHLRSLFVGVLGLLWLAGCGHKTAPEPYGTGDAALPAPQKLSIWFEPEGLVVRFYPPGGSVGERRDNRWQQTLYRLHFTYPEAGCSACTPTREGWLSTTGEGPVEAGAVWSGPDPKGAQATTLEDLAIEMRLPKSLFDPQKRLFVNLDYLNPNGDPSRSSPSLEVHIPTPVPLPRLGKVSLTCVQTWKPEDTTPATEAGAASTPAGKAPSPTNPPCLQRLLHLTWKLVLARSLQRIDPNGGIYEEQENYGLRLFNEPGQPLTDLPLLTGEAELTVPPGKLFARHQDPFGNLSEKVEVGE